MGMGMVVGMGMGMEVPNDEAENADESENPK